MRPEIPPTDSLPDPEEPLDDAAESLLAECIDRLNAGEPLDVERLLAENPTIGPLVVRQLKIFEGGDLSPDPSRPLGALGDYQLRRKIGRGGMGVVYEAWQSSMDRRVALKVLPTGMAADTKTVVRFVREARAAGKLHHPHVVSVYGMGVEADTPYYAMEYVEGQTLAQLLKGLKDAEPDAATAFGKKDDVRYHANIAEAFAGVADGLQHAHSKGIVHHDIKPSNLILDAEGRLRILDFGLAHLEGQESLTGSGEFLGTPLYMSPEQARRRAVKIDHRTDIYSLGATLYAVLAGGPPFLGKDHSDTLSQIIERDPVELTRRNPRIPRDLETIVLKCLRKDPGDRYGTAEALGQDLRRFVRGDPIEARPQSKWDRLARRLRRWWRKAAVLLLAACLLGCGTWILLQAKSAADRRDREEHERLVLRAALKIELGHLTSSGGPGGTALLGTASLLGPQGVASLLDDEAPKPLREALEDLARAIELCPWRVEARYCRARALRLLEEKEEALAELEGALRRQPDFPPALILRERLLGHGEVLERWRAEGGIPGVSAKHPWAGAWLEVFLRLEKEDWKGATEAYDRLKRRRGGEDLYLGASVEILFGRGVAYLEAGEPEESLEDFSVARHLWPDSLEPVLLLVRCHAERGAKALADSTARKLHGEWEKKDEAAFWIAAAYSSLGDQDGALHWLDQIQDLPFKEKVKARFFYMLRRFEDACGAARRAIALDPDDPIGYFLLGEAMKKWGFFTPPGDLEVDRRLAIFQEAVRREPRYSEAWASLGLEHWYRGEIGKAIECCEEAIKLDPKRISGYWYLMVILSFQGKPKEASSRCEEPLLKYGRRSCPVHRVLGHWLSMQGKDAEAFEALERGLSFDSIWKEACRLDAAAVAVRLGRYGEAVRLCEEASPLDPNSSSSPEPLVFTLGKAGRIDEAVSVARKAVEGDPAAPELNLPLAWALEAKGDTEGALESLLRAFGIDPSCAEAHREIVRILEERPGAALPQGDPLDRALEALEAAASKDDADPALLGTLALLEMRAPGRKDLEKALAWARRGVEATGGKDPRSLAAIAEVEFAAGAPAARARAIRRLEEALQLPGAMPRHRELLELFRKESWPLLLTFASIDEALGALPAERGTGEELLRSLESAFESPAPGVSSEALGEYLRGSILERAGKPVEALEAFRKASALEPNRPEPRLRVAGCLALSGDPAAAANSLLKALEESPALPREVWDRWLTLCLDGLGMAPAKVLELFPQAEGDGAGSSYASDLQWLLERLSRREPIRIDCGAREDGRGSRGEDWGRDRFYRGGRWTPTWFPWLPWVYKYSYSDEIDGTEDDPLYRTERWFPEEEVEGGYRIPLPKGFYRIALGFAEISNTLLGTHKRDMAWIEKQGAGPRRFAVQVEGRIAVEDCEPVRKGFAAADVHAVETEVLDGILEIRLLPKVGDPIISAIEIQRLE
jgi:serine/threonine protein kinase/predicted Zn-dependent protease